MKLTTAQYIQYFGNFMHYVMTHKASNKYAYMARRNIITVN